jgi:glycosyltransferase involved in cell wall biosynthesis
MSGCKKILYLRTDIDKQELIAGGSASHTVGVIQGFLVEGYDVVYASSLIIPDVDRLPLQERILLKNPKMFAFLRWKINCLLSNIFFTYQLLKIKKNQISFIYQRYSLLNCVGVVLRAVKGIPLVLEYNGSEVWVARNWVHKKRFSCIWLLRLFENINIRKADTIVVVSQALKDELVSRAIDPKKIIVNPNGVDVEEYNSMRLVDQRNHLRKKLKIENKFVFGFVGTFSQWHGINVLIAIIPEIIKQRSDVHFVLIGDGPLKKSLQETIEEHEMSDYTTFTGIIPPHKAREYLAACDAFLCPTQPNPDGSRFFGSPTKLFEYMSLGKPIIASDLEQIAEIIEPAIRDITHVNAQAVGVLMPSTDYYKFTQAALWITNSNKDDLHAMGERIRAKAVNHYTWHVHSRRIIEYARNS